MAGYPPAGAAVKPGNRPRRPVNSILAPRSFTSYRRPPIRIASNRRSKNLSTDSADSPKTNVASALLAEPHHGLAEGIRSLLGTMFDAVVMVADETSLIEAAERLCPQLAVVDLGLVRMDVDGFMYRLRARCPGLRAVFLSAHDEITVARSVLEAGADGFVVRRRIAPDLIPAVEAVLRGERYGPQPDPGASVPGKRGHLG